MPDISDATTPIPVVAAADVAADPAVDTGPVVGAKLPAQPNGSHLRHGKTRALAIIGGTLLVGTVFTGMFTSNSDPGAPSAQSPVATATGNGGAKAPSQSASPTVEALPGSDLQFSLTEIGADKFGNVVEAHAQVLVANDGADASGPVNISLSRDGVPIQISGAESQVVGGPDGSLPDLTMNPDHTVTIPGIPGLPSKGTATVVINYERPAATEGTVTAKVTATGATIETAKSTPTARELG